MEFDQCIIHSPLGDLIARASTIHLLELRFTEFSHSTYVAKSSKENHILKATQEELGEYFSGKRKTFTLPLAPVGTLFQKKAWEALKRIPYGETRSYKEEAILAENPKAVRAIGGANNKNPIVIIIPCHRVIGSDGNLVGYGGGIERKKWLLDFEKSQSNSVMGG